MKDDEIELCTFVKKINMQLLDGRATADEIKKELAAAVIERKKEGAMDLDRQINSLRTTLLRDAGMITRQYPESESAKNLKEALGSLIK